MKKTFLTAFAALLVAIPAVQAQKVNKSGLLTKIEKSDADIADAKKNAKASTWINRGKALYEAAVEPTKSLFVNMDAAMLKLAVGEPSATKQVTLLNVPYEAWEYPYFIAYIKDGKVVTWTQTDWVLKEAPAMAIEAYNKAYEIDPKSAAKAKDGLQQISDFCSQVGNTGIDTGEYVAAADAYATAFRAQSSPAYGAAADPALLYYAGYLRTVDGSAHPSSFGQGAEYLKKAIDLGVSKINVNTECQLAFADATRKYIEAGKDLEGKGFDPRKLLAPGAEAIKATVKEKMELFGSVGKAE